MMLRSKSRLISGLSTLTDDGRTHQVRTDLPPEQGGENQGTSPLELVVMAYSSCTVTLFKLIAERKRISIDDLEVIVEAEKLDPMGTILSLKSIIRVKSIETQEKLEKIMDMVIKSCPVGAIIEKANIPSLMSLEKV